MAKLRFVNQDEAREAMPELDPLVATILYGRGIKNSEEGKIHLYPEYTTHTHNPFLMKDMDKAVERVLGAIEKQEKIALYCDYDADGIPGAVMWDDFMKRIGYKNYEIYIPDRHEEGFGLNIEAVEKLAESGVNLLITLDCGITDVEEVARANELGLNVIITDHHLPGEVIPEAFAILNPKQAECKYPEKMLCGSGVGFKFIQAIIEKGNQKKLFNLKDGTEKWFLDMVGIATLSDMVPLLGENRVLAHFGLKVLRKSPRVGLQKLLSELKVNQSLLVEDDVGFTISPRINVASRMASPMKAFSLLSTTEHGEAGLLVSELEGLNHERKGLVASIVKDIKKRMREEVEYLTHNVLSFGHTHWRPAVLGLASNSIMREVRKPVFVWGREGGEVIKGSCRSDGSVNLVELMQATAPGVFVDFGGHALSGGFSVHPEKIHDLSIELNKAFEKLTRKDVDDEVMVDARITPEDVGKSLWQKVSLCAPFGTGNPKPLFLLENVRVKELKQFGKQKEHIELTLVGESGRSVKAIEFFGAESDKYTEVFPGSPINLLAHLEESLFKSYPEYRLRIVDLI